MKESHEQYFCNPIQSKVEVKNHVRIAATVRKTPTNSNHMCPYAGTMKNDNNNNNNNKEKHKKSGIKPKPKPKPTETHAITRHFRFLLFVEVMSRYGAITTVVVPLWGYNAIWLPTRYGRTLGWRGLSSRVL